MLKICDPLLFIPPVQARYRQRSWHFLVNQQLTEDATRVKRDRSNRRAIDTWKPLLKKTGDLLNNWLDFSEVLVSRRPP
jgi:hypothetical protein